MKFNSFALLCLLLAGDFASAASAKSYAYSELIFDSKMVPQGDSFTSIEHRQNFWNIHERFGFVSENGSTYLLAKNQKIFDHVLQNLKNAKLSLDESSAPTKVTPGKNSFSDLGNGKGVLADVTSLIPNRFAGLNEYSPSRNGPNCWNLALYMSKVIFSLHETLPQEFKFIVGSPIARTLTSVERLEPGDIIVFRYGTEEVHAAVFLSPDLVLTKNGTDESRPYRLMELNEMAAQYLNPHPVFEMRLSDRWLIVRLSPLDKYVTENLAQISEKTLATYQDLKSLEEKINTVVLPDSKSSLTTKDVIDLVKAFQAAHPANLETAKTFLDTAILMRINSLRSF